MEPEGARQPTELELLRMRMNAKTDETLESTRRMVQLADQSQKVGAATMETLHHQGEQLRRVDQNMDVIHEDMRVAEGQLEELEKCCGLCVLPWKKPKRRTNTNAAFRSTSARYETRDPQRAATQQPVSNASANQPSIPGQNTYITRITNDAREDEMEENLQQVATIVGDLRVMAGDMGQEIRTHNEVLDRIDRKADANQIQITEAQARAERIVGVHDKRAPQNGSERGKLNTAIAPSSRH
ncbi:Synaptosomal-associated protein 25 [Fasciola hepatica]|uniref:Synaptosomal-associated protein 25 n=1 Tax=Fasciola hepatica TaxID=6192 RepID=A0A4E0RUA2_FASHE|nr:Synaptosomal-associated protein 25 [Fasciola hepatica]